MGLLMGIFILCIVAFVGLIFIAVRSNRSSDRSALAMAKRMDLGNLIKKYNFDLKYLGGHPYHLQPSSAYIYIFERGFALVASNKLSANPYSTLKDVQVLSQEQLTKDPKSSKTALLNLTIVINGIENHVSIKTTLAGQIASSLNERRLSNSLSKPS